MPRNSFIPVDRKPITTPLSVRAIGRSSADALSTVPRVTTQIAATAVKSLEVTSRRSRSFAFPVFFIADSSIRIGFVSNMTNCLFESVRFASAALRLSGRELLFGEANRLAAGIILLFDCGGKKKYSGACRRFAGEKIPIAIKPRSQSQ